VSPEKGVHVLLEAFEIIVRKYPDASLIIVGPEWIPPREYLADLCLERKVVEDFAHFYEGSYVEKLKQNLSPEAAKQVIFTGLVPHRDVPRYYANADIYVSPSFYESFGMSIIEAMAAGLPVVAARGGAVPDLISDGSNGLLVDPANPAAIAKGVEDLIKNHRLRKSIACAAREIVCKKFSYGSICSVLMEVYQDVVSRPFDSQQARTSL
jgi:glycosyltransferase involved in cell wall biosynthesis